MSKPIEVVVVVIVVVVFDKKKLGPKIFDPKEIPCQKTQDLKVLDPKKMYVKKVRSKNCPKKIKVQQNFESKTFWVQKRR